MTIGEARRYIKEYNELEIHTEEEDFQYTESLSYLIHKNNDPRAMMELGGWYYEKKQFDLALKYYEMAATFGHDAADECLGYIWYYGRTGERDYEKAFKHFKAAMDRGNLVATYKVADMYKNGYFVEKSFEKYKEIIEGLYPKTEFMENVFDPVPEIFTRLARIRSDEGDKDEAISLYLYARDFLAQRIRYSHFFGNLNIMKWLVDDLYKLVEFGSLEPMFYDLYYILKSPGETTIIINGKEHKIVSTDDGINYEGKWYRNVDEFMGKAQLGSVYLTEIYDEIEIKEGE